MVRKFVKNDEGVSAVIGVILMVAITVILAAVIAAFVFGMVGNMGPQKSPAFTSKRISDTEIQFTLQNKGGATTIGYLDVTQPADTTITPIGNVASTTNIAVGDVYTLREDSGHTGVLSGTKHIVLTATVDGKPQVVFDQDV